MSPTVVEQLTRRPVVTGDLAAPTCPVIGHDGQQLSKSNAMLGDGVSACGLVSADARVFGTSSPSATSNSSSRHMRGSRKSKVSSIESIGSSLSGSTHGNNQSAAGEPNEIAPPPGNTSATDFKNDSDTETVLLDVRGRPRTVMGIPVPPVNMWADPDAPNPFEEAEVTMGMGNISL